MTHSLLLEVPESIYQSIVEEAEAEGRKVEEIALERLANGKPKKIYDPLDEFVGAFRSDIRVVKMNEQDFHFCPDFLEIIFGLDDPFPGSISFSQIGRLPSAV